MIFSVLKQLHVIYLILISKILIYVRWVHACAILRSGVGTACTADMSDAGLCCYLGAWQILYLQVLYQEAGIQ